MSQTDNLTRLQKAILADAQEEADTLLAQARERAGFISKQGESRARAAASRLVADAKEEVNTLQERAAARARLDAQMLTLRHREELLNQVFEKARAQLAASVQQEEWPMMAHNLLVEALNEMGLHSDPDGFIVHADTATQTMLGEATLEDIAEQSEIMLAFGEPLTDRTGILVSTHDGHRQFDNTLEARYERMKDELRVGIYNILTGQAQ